MSIENEVEAGEGYRLLSRGEIIQGGDEYLRGNEWFGTLRFGQKAGGYKVYRRKIANEVEPGEGYRLLEVGEEIKEGDEDGIERRRKLEPKTPDCPFEVGKEYPMRGGGVFRVYATDAGGPKPIHGAKKCSGFWVLGCRTVGGCLYLDSAESASDLIPPNPIADDAWPDCIAEGAWYARDKNGGAYLFECEPYQHDGKACWDVDNGVNVWLFRALFPDFPHPPADLHWTKTKCQKPSKGGEA